MATRVRRHIPDASTGKTFCGRPVASVLCIDKETTPIDDAECKACQRGDDRRTRESYAKERRESVRALAVKAAQAFAAQFPGKVIFPSVPARIESVWLLVPEDLREEPWAWRNYRNAFSDTLLQAFKQERAAELAARSPGLVSCRPTEPTREGQST